MDPRASHSSLDRQLEQKNAEQQRRDANTWPCKGRNRIDTLGGERRGHHLPYAREPCAPPFNRLQLNLKSAEESYSVPAEAEPGGLFVWLPTPAS